MLQEDGAADRGPSARHDRAHGRSVRRERRAGEVGDRSRDVHVRHQRARGGTGRDHAGIPDHEGDTDRLFVGVHLVAPPVFPVRHSVVGREDDQRRPGPCGLAQRAEHPRDEVVDGLKGLPLPPRQLPHEVGDDRTVVADVGRLVGGIRLVDRRAQMDRGVGEIVSVPCRGERRAVRRVRGHHQEERCPSRRGSDEGNGVPSDHVRRVVARARPERHTMRTSGVVEHRVVVIGTVGSGEREPTVPARRDVEIPPVAVHVLPDQGRPIAHRMERGGDRARLRALEGAPPSVRATIEIHPRGV